MEGEDDKLLEAVGAAVDAATPADVRQADVVEDTDVDGAASTDSGDDTAAPEDTATADDKAKPGDGAGKTKPSAKDGEDQAAADPNADRGDGRNAKGHFVKKQGETDADFEKRKAAAPAKGKDGEIDPKTGKPKPPDHINDPIPAELKGKTRERIEGLVTAAKTLTQERDTARKTVKEFDDAIKATGADPDTFARHMDLLGAMLSDDPQDQRAAMRALRAAADKLAADIGETPTGKDPLEGHQDLIDKVEDGDITKDLAIELAEARNRKKAEETRTTRRTETDEATREHNEAVDAARAELNTYGAQLAKDDKLFATKAKILLPAVQAMAASTHPSKWLAAYKKMYENLKLAAPTDTRQRVPAGTGERQPRRPTQGAGAGGKPAPASLEQAIDFGIEAERASRAR